jgi:hypothetical protein
MSMRTQHLPPADHPTQARGATGPRIGRLLAMALPLVMLGAGGAALAQTSAPRPAAAASAAAPGTGAGPSARAGGGSGAEQACRAADHNHDGYIALDEYHRDIARSWAALGPDATGHVRLEDLAAIPGLRRSVLERLRRADTDGDGRLSFKEVVTARMAQFDAADLDRDDRLSTKECVDHERKLSAELRELRRRPQQP